ncbi:TPA: IS6 family transposase, partial [Staphylococcus aureus]
MNYFRYKQFDKDVITVAVGYYLRYALSYRDISEILRERGVNVHHSTVYRWVQEYAPILYQIWKKKHKKAYYKWHIDETYIKIKGKWCYLYSAINADGYTLDIWVRKQRDNHAAYAFIKRLIKQF